MKRRQSLKLISSLPLVAAFPSVALAKEAAPKADKKTDKKAAGKEPANLLSEKDTMANAMQYKHDASKASKMRTNKKAFCDNCAKYNVCMAGDTACKPLKPKELKTATAAPCQIFKAKVVKGKGWCLSWQAKV